MKKLWSTPIKGYQYISKMLPASCRYYPTCSEYAKWQFTFNTPYKAFVATSTRILRCNQLFKGGIDYPFINFRPPAHTYVLTFNPEYGKIEPHYWFVPKNTKPTNSHYYIIKDFNAIKRTIRHALTPT